MLFNSIIHCFDNCFQTYIKCFPNVLTILYKELFNVVCSKYFNPASFVIESLVCRLLEVTASLKYFSTFYKYTWSKLLIKYLIDIFFFLCVKSFAMYLTNDVVSSDRVFNSYLNWVVLTIFYRPKFSGFLHK